MIIQPPEMLPNLRYTGRVLTTFFSHIAFMMLVFIVSLLVSSSTTRAATSPDITFQAALCLDSKSDAIKEMQAELSSMIQQSQQSHPELFTNPSLQIGCINGRETIGIWFARSSSPSDLSNVDILTPHVALMAINMSAAAARSLVSGEWSKYQSDNPNPPYKYGGFDITYDDKKKTVKTTFHASKQGVHASVEILDTLALNGNGFPVSSSIASYHYNDTLLEALAGFFAPILVNEGLDIWINSQAVSPEATLFGESFYNQPNNNISGNGLGSGFAALVPTTILTPLNAQASPPKMPGKLVFRFRSISLSPTDGMTFFTQNPMDVPQKIEPREPAILQIQPFQTYVYESAAATTKNISVRLKIGFRDLRPDAQKPIKITWSAQSGKIVSTADGGTYALATFGNLPASQRTVGSRTKLGSVTIQATDADNISVSATFPVFAKVEDDPPVGPPPKKDGKPIMKQP